MSARIVLGLLVRAQARRDGRPGSAGRVVEARSADGDWLFVAEYGAWTAEHVPTGRVLTHAARSLHDATSSASWLLAELDNQKEKAA